jgi:hypothetical protein
MNLCRRSLGLKLSLMGLTNGILERSSVGYADRLQPRIIAILGELIENRTAARDYAYYGLPSPWLQVRFAPACPDVWVGMGSTMCVLLSWSCI